MLERTWNTFYPARCPAARAAISGASRHHFFPFATHFLALRVHLDAMGRCQRGGMAKKRKVFIHLDLGAGAATGIETALFTHRHALEALGVRVAPQNGGEMFLAAIEMTRTHKAWGYRRREVEGTWAGICRRIIKTKGKDDFVLSQPLLVGAAPEQIDLLVDQLPGLAVHVVLVMPTDAAAGDVVARWSRAVRKPERLHVVEVADHQGVAHVWRELGRIAGFGTTSLSVDEPTSHRLTAA